MKVAVFGLGYVGCVSAICLAELGHMVVGVDIQSAKVQSIASGQAPVTEPGLSERVQRLTTTGHLKATTQAAEAMAFAEIILICVGTPSNRNGGLDYSHLDHVISEIATLLHTAAPYPVIAIRSTVLPGSPRQRILARIEAISKQRVGINFGFCLNPEFLREGTAIADFYTPPFTLIGELEPRAGDRLAQLYEALDAPMVRTDLDTAAMVKYASNVYHAMKITFANEIGTLCKTTGVDSHVLMDIFSRDYKLNISPAYLRPGFAFGGSCLPKDLRALLHLSRHADLDLPLLNSVLPSNEVHLRRALDLVEAAGQRRIGLLGLTFKPGTDDLRESPLVILSEMLLGRGYDLRIFDKELSLSRMVGTNRQYIENTIPHIASLLCDTLPDLLRHADAVIIGKSLPELKDSLTSAHNQIPIVDLVRLFPPDELPDSISQYQGICW